MLSHQLSSQIIITCSSTSPASALFCFVPPAAAVHLCGLLTRAAARAGLPAGVTAACNLPTLFVVLGCTAAMRAAASASGGGFDWYSRLWLRLCAPHFTLATWTYSYVCHKTEARACSHAADHSVMGKAASKVRVHYLAVPEWFSDVGHRLRMSRFTDSKWLTCLSACLAASCCTASCSVS